MTVHLDVGQDDRILDRAVAMHVNVGEKKRAPQQRAADDAAARHQRVERRARALRFLEHEFRGRQLILVGPDGPLFVVQIEFGRNVCQIEVCLPERVDRAHVAPIGLAFDHVDARIREAMGEYLGAAIDEVGNQVLAEVVAGMRVGGIADQLFVKKRRVEDVDAHACQRHVREPRSRLGLRGLFVEANDVRCRIDGHHAILRRGRERNLDAANRDVGLATDVLGEELRIVHLVDVIAGENQNVPRRVAAQDVEVLVDRVRGPFVPVDGDALLRG